MLFNDDNFDQPESIVFDWNPLFFGMGRERYTYTRATLQETILKEMERENWMGVCCEPNMVFIICNQFPVSSPVSGNNMLNNVPNMLTMLKLIAMRYNDVTNGTHVIDEVLPKYKAAWAEKGMLSSHGLFRRNYAVRQDKVLDTDEISHSAWYITPSPPF